MSTGGLATQSKHIGESVPKGSVTAPVVPAKMHDDVDRKLRLIGVIEAFRKGNYPSNKQIDETLTWLVKEGSPIDEKKLSSEGRTLIKDARRIIETAHKMVLEKNDDELAQNFLWHTRHVDTDRAGGIKAPISKTEAQEHGDQAVEHLRTLGRLIFTNAEFRKILKDVSYLGRDIAADAAAKAADSARPGEEKLAQIEQTSGDPAWVDRDGSRRGAHEPVPSTGVGEKVDKAKEAKAKVDAAKEDAKHAAVDTAKTTANAASNQPGDNTDGPSAAQKNAAQNTAADKAQEHKETLQKHIPQETQERMKQEAEDAKNRMADAIGNARGPTTREDVLSGRLGDIQDLAKGGNGGANGLSQEEKDAAIEEGKRTAKNKLKSVIPEQHREKVEQKFDETKEYLKEKLPEERRNRFIYRLKKVVADNQRHNDYQEAIEYFLGLAETYQGHAKHVAKQADGNVGAVRADPALSQAENELRTLLERFANNQSMQPIIDSVNQIYQDVQDDPELRRWFKDLDSYIRRVLQEPGYVLKESCDREAKRLQDDSNGVFNERYRGHREAFFNSMQDFFTSFADDPLNKRFGDDWKRLTKDLFLDGEGNLKYKQHLWQDIRSVILPSFIENAGYIPIPRIEYTDKAIDLVIENLTLSSQNLLPNIFEIEARNYFKLSPYKQIADKSKHSVWVSFAQIQADLRDVAFYFKKKSGFPKLQDSGLADVVISGNGIYGKVHLETSDSKHDVFNVREVKVKIDDMKFKIRDSKHNILYNSLRPLMNSLVRKAIAKAAEAAIRSALDNVNTQLVELRDRMDKAKDDPNSSQTDVVKNIFNNKKEQAESAKEKADERDAQFKVVLAPDEKINKWESKASMVAAAGRASDIAGKGTEWRSPAFDIVGNRVTGDLKSGEVKHSGLSGSSAGAAGVGAAGVAGAAAAHHGSSSSTTAAPRSSARPISQSATPIAAQHSSQAQSTGPVAAAPAAPAHLGGQTTTGYAAAPGSAPSTTSASPIGTSNTGSQVGYQPPAGANVVQHILEDGTQRI